VSWPVESPAGFDPVPAGQLVVAMVVRQSLSRLWCRTAASTRESVKAGLGPHVGSRLTTHAGYSRPAVVVRKQRTVNPPIAPAHQNSSALLKAGPAGGRPGRSPTPMSLSAAGSWSAHGTAMGPGYLYCARRGFASDDVCTLPMVSGSVGPLVAREGFAREGLWCRAARGGVGATTCQDKAKI
jgi:hypothetical protein